MKKLSYIFGILSIFLILISCSDSEQEREVHTHVIQGPSPFKSDFFALNIHSERNFLYIFKNNEELFAKVDHIQNQKSDPLIFFNKNDQSYYKFIGKSGDKIILPKRSDK